MSVTVCSKSRVYVLVIAAVLVAQLMLLSWPTIAKAEVWTIVWTWTDLEPTVFESKKISDATTDLCLTQKQTREVVGEEASKQICVTAGDKVRFGTYFNGHSFTSVVGFGYDSKMYKLTGVCGGFNDCLYLPAKDTLVTKQYLINGYVRSLVVYKNFTRRLSKVIGNSLPVSEYNFNAANPDFVFRSETDYAWPVGGAGASENGEWVAIEFRQRGIGLLNVETLAMRRVSTMAFSYGTGYDPTSELAVSDDGRHVAVMGMNAGLTVFDITPTCGDEATDERMASVAPIMYPCKVANLDTNNFIYRFSNGLHPRLNHDGGELTFHAISYTGEAREVSLRAAGYSGQRIDYLALGDSFTSGEGETDDKYYVNGTNDKYEKCHLSTRSYPYLIAAKLKVEQKYMKSVACSGAVTSDIIGDDLKYWGEGARLGEKGLALDKSVKTISQSSAKDLFIPGRVHQIGFVKKYSPKVITVGIGGNDAGLMEKLKACIGTGTCSWAGTAIGREKTALEIQALFGTLVNTYSKLHDESPSSKIYAIGYPKVIDSLGKCDKLHGSLLDAAEKEFMDETITYINQIMAAAAQKAGIEYVSIEDSLGAQTLCGDKKPSVMNGIRIGDDTTPWAILPWLTIIGQESFHPRPTGHSMAADAIVKAIPNLLTYDYCPESVNTCPRDVTVPTPSIYWLPDGVTHNYPSQHLAYFTQNTVGATNQRQKTIKLDDYSLAPNSSIKTEILSEPVELGNFIADANGGANFGIELPQDLEEGFHTIHLYGTSYSGEQVDLYEVIKYDLGTTVSESFGQVPIMAEINNNADVRAIPQTGSVIASLPVSPVASDANVLGATSVRPVESASGMTLVSKATGGVLPLDTSGNTKNNDSYIMPIFAASLLGFGSLVYLGLRRSR